MFTKLLFTFTYYLYLLVNIFSSYYNFLILHIYKKVVSYNENSTARFW